MKLKLPFGIKNKQLVQIADVYSGLKCNCYCPACGHPLVARKGKITIHHFAHHKKSDCQTAFETSLHIAAKKVIEDSGYIVLPSVKNGIFYIRQLNLYTPFKLVFDKIHIEKRYNNYIPDLIVEKNGKYLFIEIFVSHSVDDTKLKKIKDSNTSAIEIDLSKSDRNIDFKFIKEQVVDSVKNKMWLNNIKRNELHKRIISYAIKKRIISRGFARHVDGCPLPSRVWKGKSYANFTDDCLGCDFFVLPLSSEDDKLIYCIGHITEKEIIDLVKL